MALVPVAEKFTEGQWKGRRVFIVGGGTSLREFPFHLLKDELVIAVNRAHECGVADVIFSGDRRWLDHFSQFSSVPAKVPLVYGRRDHVRGRLRRAHRYRNIYYIRCSEEADWGTSFEEGITRGGSGLRATNFAALLGAEQIYLLGIDMCHPPGPHPKMDKRWWHAGYEVKPLRRICYADLRRAWYLAAEAPERTTEIINLSPISTLDCFPKKDWKEVLSEPSRGNRSGTGQHDRSPGSGVLDQKILP